MNTLELVLAMGAASRERVRDWLEAELFQHAIPRAGVMECDMSLNLKKEQPAEGDQGGGEKQGGAQGMVDKIVDKVKSALGVEGENGEGQQTNANGGEQAQAQNGDAGEQADGDIFGRKPFIGAPVLFTHPDGVKVHAAIIGGIREHGGCDLFVLKPGDQYWEANIKQGDGPNMWRPNYGDQQ